MRFSERNLYIADEVHQKQYNEACYEETKSLTNGSLYEQCAVVPIFIVLKLSGP